MYQRLELLIMKKLSFVLILILFGSVSVFCQSISDVSLSGEYEDRSLKEILDEIEKHKSRQDTAGFNARAMNRTLDNLRRKGSLFKGGQYW